MKTKIENGFFDLILSKSNLEIIKELQKSKTPLQFKDLKTLTNPKTTKKYSTRTISESLKELEENFLITNEIVTKNKRKTLGYAITQKGEKTLEILKEAQSKYEKIEK